MIPGMNPRKMQQMMRQMGIQQVDIHATEVIIKTAEKDLIIRNPSVQKVNMMGQETLQVTGTIEELERDSIPEISEEDIQTVMDQTGKDYETVKSAIELHKGDLAETIMNLQ